MEGFFYQCRAVPQSSELKEFIFRTYSGAARDILILPWREGVEVVNEGRERTQRDRFWLMYCSMYPNMSQESFIDFDTWYEGLKRPPVPEKTADEIVADANRIIGMTIDLGGQDGITV